MARCAKCQVVTGSASEVLEHAKTCVDARWTAVAKARESSAKRGTAPRKAKRLVREIYGIETAPMPADVVEAKQASGTTNSVVKQRIKKLEKAEIKELSKPTYNPRARRSR